MKKNCNFKIKQQKTRFKIRYKYLTLLNTERFKKVTTDPTVATERKIHQVLKKAISAFSEQEDKRYYSQGSTPTQL